MTKTMKILSLIAAMLVVCSSGYAAEPFFTRYDIRTIGPSFYVTNEDYNEDGYLDMAISSSSNNSYYLSFFWGDGTGLFPNRYDRYHDGLRPNAIGSGDFDRDNNLDLAVANTFEHTLGVYLGNGDGQFNTYNVTPSGDFPTHLAVDRLNDDPFEDVLVTSWAHGKVYVFLGLGDGFFEFTDEYDVGGGTNIVNTADFFEDGIPDFAVSNMAYNDVLVMFGAGDGTFYGAKSIDVGYDVFALATTDLNNDEHVDIVCGTKHTLVTILGDGVGGFTIHYNNSYESPGVRYIEALDVDSDGNMDIAATFLENNRIRIYKGDGTGDFISHRVVNSIRSPLSLTSGDFNNDGHPDLAVASDRSDSLTVLLNQWSVTTIDLAPPDDPDVEQGSDLSFSVAATNTQDTTVTIDLWLTAERNNGREIIIPSSLISGPDNPLEITLDPDQVKEFDYTIHIPWAVAAGYYRMNVRSGYFSQDLMDERSFEGDVLERR